MEVELKRGEERPPPQPSFPELHEFKTKKKWHEAVDAWLDERERRNPPTPDEIDKREAAAAKREAEVEAAVRAWKASGSPKNRKEK